MIVSRCNGRTLGRKQAIILFMNLYKKVLRSRGSYFFEFNILAYYSIAIAKFRKIIAMLFGYLVLRPVIFDDIMFKCYQGRHS